MTISIDSTGAKTQTVQEIRDAAYESLIAENPSIPSLLTGTLQEDLLSTTAVSMAQTEQGIAALINCLAPAYAIDPVVINMGAALDLPIIASGKSTADIVITGNPGAYVASGFTVRDDDGNKFQTTNYTVIPASGSIEVTATAVADGSVVVAAGALTTIVTATTGVTSVTNPAASVASIGAETMTKYRTRLLDAMKSPTIGLPTLIKTAVKALDNVDPRLVSTRQNAGSLEVVVGGGDIYEIAAALYVTVGDPCTLVATSSDSGRNVTVNLADGADTYAIKFVRPDVAAIKIVTTYSTVSSVNNQAFEALVSDAMVSYINSMTVGQDLNVLDFAAVVADSVSTVVARTDIKQLDFSFKINDVAVSPTNNLLPISFDLYAYTQLANLAFVAV